MVGSEFLPFFFSFPLLFVLPLLFVQLSVVATVVCAEHSVETMCWCVVGEPI